MLPEVSIIILNWNGWKDTIDCLDSIFKIIYPSYDVIVVDNNSQDDSVEIIKNHCNGILKDNKTVNVYSKQDSNFKKMDKIDFNSKNMFIIQNDKNYGFARGNNIGIEFALNCLDSDYILILNNDTIVDKKFLNELIDVSLDDAKIGILGPKICPYKNNEIKSNLAIIGSELVFWLGALTKGVKDNGNIEDVDLISGSCMLITKELLKEIGLLDTTYFFGWEDADFCTKAKRLGYRVVGVPQAKVLHKIGSSYGGYFADNPEILVEGIRNQLIFMSRYASVSQKFISIPYISFSYLNIILKRNENSKQIKIKISSIKKGIQLFLEYNKFTKRD